MNFSELMAWIEKNPGMALVIGGGGLLAVMYLMGAFSPTPAATDQSGASNLAAAYYNAEAQQATIGGQIQMTTLNDAAATAINNSNNNAAVAINTAQVGAAQTINQQNVNGAINVAGQALQATYSNNAAAVQVAQSNNNLAATIGGLQLQAVQVNDAAAQNMYQTAGMVAEYQAQQATQQVQAANSGFTLF